MRSEVRTPVKINARPLSAVIVDTVQIIGITLKYAIKTPLIKPHKAPTTIPVVIIRNMAKGTFISGNLSPINDTMTPATPAIEPTEISIPPSIIT